MSTPPGYSRVQIVLHWIVALLIAQQFLFKDAISNAWDAARAGMETSFDPLVAAHIVGGALVMVFALWRLMIKARRGAPAAAGDSAVQRALARVTHAGFYLLMILMPASGAAAWFGGVEAAASVHSLLKVVLLALVALHVVGALYHHFVLKDGLLHRMRRAET